MNKTVALFILLAGAAFAIGAYNPLGEPNLHPAPWVVCSGAAVAIVGAWLMGYKVEPRPPRARGAAICVIIAMAVLAVGSLVS